MGGFVFDPVLANKYASEEFASGVGSIVEALGVKVFDDFDDEHHESMMFLTRRAGPVKFTEDVFLLNRKVPVEQEIGRQIGQIAAKEVRTRLLQVASVSAWKVGRHVNDVYAPSGAKSNLTLSGLYDTRMKLEGNYNRLTTVVCDRHAFMDLVADSIGNYKVTNVGDMMVVTGLPQAFGMKVVVVDNDDTLSPCMISGDKHRKYRTLLLGSGALGLYVYQSLRFEAERRLDFEAPYWRVLAGFDFMPYVLGTKWMGAENPDNDTLVWEKGLEVTAVDHKEVLCAEFVHNASV